MSATIIRSRVASECETTPLLNSLRKSVSESGRYAGVGGGGEVKMKKEMTMFGAVGVIFSLVVGNGIFISPIGITQYVGSVGLSLLIWAVCGVLNIMCALCYAELGAMIPETGGDYAFMYIGLGPLPAFLNMWLLVLVLGPVNIAVLGRTMGTYLLAPVDGACYGSLVTLMAMWMALTFAMLNGRSVRASMFLQNIFGMTKILALVFIISVGFVRLTQGYTYNFENAFEGSTVDATSISMGLFLGYYSFLGWADVCALTEEMEDPGRDLPRAIWIAMLIVISVFVAANIAYFSVLSPLQLVSSNAVVLDFVRNSAGPWAVWLMSVLIALSCAGSVSVTLLTNSRYLFAAGRRKQLPQICCMIHNEYLSPLPGIIILCFISLLYCLIDDIESLMTYLLVTEQLRIILSLIALIFLRWKRPHAKRPVQVNLVMVVALLAIIIWLLGVSAYKSPFASGVGLLIFLLGIPVYLIMEHLKTNKTANVVVDNINTFFQQLLMVLPEN